MAGRSPPRMTVAAAAERACRVPRLRVPRRGHPPPPRAEWGTAGKTARAPPPAASIPGLRRSGYLARGWGEDTTLRKKTGASDPGRFGKFGRLVPHWGDSCAVRTRTRPRTPIPPPLLTLPSRGWEAAAKARAQRQRALDARGRARRHVTAGDPALSGSRELPKSLKVPGTFLLWA